MNNPIFMTVEGSTQGAITDGAYTKDSVGNSYQEGHEDSSVVKGFEHNITIPRDPLSGQPSGQRVHSPLEVTKLFDKSSPLFYNALVNGETLTKVELKMWRINYEGQPEHFMTTTLEDAVIVDIQADTNLEGGEATTQVAPFETISFAYRKISWRHEVSSTSGEDDWRKGVGAK